MSRPKGAMNRDNRGEKEPFPVETLKEIDGQVLDSMSKTNRMRLTHSDPNSLTLRQKQMAGAEYLAGLVGHPEYRRRLAAAALQDPVSVLKIASSERPKEVHVEGEVLHAVVVVPTQLTAEEWDKQIKTIEADTVTEEGWETQSDGEPSERCT